MAAATAPAQDARVFATFRESPVAVKAILIGMLVNRLGTFLNIFLVLYMTHRGFTQVQAGTALGVYGFGGVAGVLVGTALADKLGARRATVLSMAGRAVLMVGILYLRNFPALLVDVAGHEVAFDAARGLWYCDVVFPDLASYEPFVRLALARYQPSSIAGVELSHVVLTDFAQLTPTRSASLTVDPATPTKARLVVGGSAPDGPTQSVVAVTVEEYAANIGTDLGWAYDMAAVGQPLQSHVSAQLKRVESVSF